MAEAICSTILEPLASIFVKETTAKVKLIAGAEDQVEDLRHSFHLIEDVLKDAEKRQVMASSVRDWLDDVKHTSYDMEDVLDEWNTAIRQLRMRTVSSSFIISSYWFSPGQLARRHHIATGIKNLNKKLDNINRNMIPYGCNTSLRPSTVALGPSTVASRPSTTSFLDESYEVRGREHLQIKVANLLMSGSESSTVSTGGSSQVPTQLPIIISITGMGGIGKTTLARLIFNDNVVSAHFDKKIWVCVSEPFDDIRIAKAILESLEGKAPDAVEPQSVLTKLREAIGGKKFFLVLDDVWTEQLQDWEQLWGCLRCGSNRSRILVTTRNEKVASVIGTAKSNIIPIELLSDEDCWSIFSQVALSRRSDIEEYEKIEKIGRQIVDSRLEKDKLIRLWMAQDYLKVEGREDMEVVGEEYFENLTMRSLFQDFERSEHAGGKIISCKMHDIVRDFSQSLTKTECSALNVNESQLELPHRKARHLMIIGAGELPFPSFVYNQTKLRSLALDEVDFKPTIAPSKLFDRLTCLRSIDGLRVGQIPKGIKKLIHLRYLALGRSRRVKELPEALCELCNLQTLDVSRCLYLKRLPERIGDLINLRHLINSWQDDLSYMPRGMERLTGLRTLGSFVASGGKSSKACSSLKSLNKLKHLQGSLTLRGLGNERDLGDDIDDEKVDLKSKMKLVDLHLWFNSTRKTKDHRVVLECLQPPPSLKKLGIYGYEAEDDQARADQAETASSIFRDTAFPSLETLEFLNMGNWEEWDDCEITGGKTIMPRLRHLSIIRSPELKALPDYILGSTSLDKLRINRSHHLNNRYNNETGPDWPKISHIPNIRFDGPAVQGSL
ncbi:hypothetical protein KPL71_020302 [Citrus sinensis]|uniref:Uncharacterized protein n=1 Tax=Citrus sinensis TaxID=2711 RepID=A0ACB8J6V4_CITSI|nr:hypothetical protein KPL71_020302 [Citrus sinensis]